MIEEAKEEVMRRLQNIERYREQLNKASERMKEAEKELLRCTQLRDETYKDVGSIASQLGVEEGKLQRAYVRFWEAFESAERR